MHQGEAIEGERCARYAIVLKASVLSHGTAQYFQRQLHELAWANIVTRTKSFGTLALVCSWISREERIRKSFQWPLRFRSDQIEEKA